MRARLITVLFGLMAVHTFSSALFGQAAGQLSAAKTAPDISGIWMQGGGMSGGTTGRGFGMQAPPLQPAADVVYILFEYNSGVRRIYTDGRKHPEDAEPTWMGHSTGAWQGDTLVVDTVALRPETWLDPLGTPHSDALHMVERFRRPNRDTLEVEFLFDDPETFTKPWGGKRVYRLESTEISEYIVCEEQLQMGNIRGTR